MDETDDLIKQRMRKAAVLTFAPGRLQDPEIGPQVGILTYACAAEIEKPLAFDIADVRRLVIHGLVVLATFDDDRAEEVLRQHFPEVIAES